MMRIRSEEEILGSLYSELIYRAGFTEVRPGGNVPQLLPPIARRLFNGQFDQLSIRDSLSWSRAKGPDLDYIGMMVLPESLRRLRNGRKSIGGAVLFYANPVPSADIQIEAGTAVGRSSDGFVFYTVAARTILSGAGSSVTPVAVVASSPGTIGNCIAGDIDTMVTSIKGVTSVVNTSSFANGIDREEDDNYRIRIKDYMKSRGSVTGPALLRAVLGFESTTYGGVTSAAMSYPTETTPGVASIYIDNGTGECDVPSAFAAGEVLLLEAAGGETDLYLAGRPVVTPPIVSITPSGGAPGAVTYNLFRPWGLCRLNVPMEDGDYAEAGAYTAYAALVKEVQDLINGELQDPSNESLDGNISAGTIVNVRPAQKHLGGYTTVRASVVFHPLVNAQAERARLTSLVVNSVNTLGVGAPGLRAAIAALLFNEPTVKNVTSVKLNGVDADVLPPTSRVVRTRDADVTIL